MRRQLSSHFYSGKVPPCIYFDLYIITLLLRHSAGTRSPWVTPCRYVRALQVPRCHVHSWSWMCPDSIWEHHQSLLKHVKYIPVHCFIKAVVFGVPESAGRIDDSRISLTCLPLLLKLLEIPFNVREGTFLTHDTVTMNQRETKRKKMRFWTKQCQTT